jgi:hypothetical protein
MKNQITMNNEMIIMRMAVNDDREVFITTILFFVT